MYFNISHIQFLILEYFSIFSRNFSIIHIIKGLLYLHLRCLIKLINSQRNADIKTKVLVVLINPNNEQATKEFPFHVDGYFQKANPEKVLLL